VRPGLSVEIRPLAERDHNVAHWAEFSRGGHFAALEALGLLTGDIREFFRQLRLPGQALVTVRGSKRSRAPSAHRNRDNQANATSVVILALAPRRTEPP
jgi:hypothetical protein